MHYFWFHIRQKLAFSQAKVQDLTVENLRLRTQVDQFKIERSSTKEMNQSGNFQLFEVDKSSEISHLVESMKNDKCSHIIFINRGEFDVTDPIMQPVELRKKKNKPVARVTSQPIMPNTSDSDEPDLT